MLVSMTVRNIALIEKLDLHFHRGLHVLTGETGAGKSIVVDSINLILGERADRGLIRTGCEKATVEAIFDISDCPGVRTLLAEQSLEPEGDLVPVMREITTADRNLCRICGVIVPLSLLKQMTGFMVDLHGQHEHQSLLDENKHLGFLDACGGNEHRGLLSAVEEKYRQWRESGAAFSTLRKENIRREERVAEISAQCKELDAAQPTVGEEARLSLQKAKMADAEKIAEAISLAYSNLAAADGERQGAAALIKEAAEGMRRISEYDPRFAALSERLTSAFYEMEEAGLELRDLSESESFDPDENERVLARLDTYRKLEKHYGMEADALADYAERLKDEMKGFSAMDERLRVAEGDYKAKLADYRAAAKRLTESRETLAKRFEGEMEKQLSELGMGNARFACVFAKPELEQKRVPSPAGDDQVTFYIAPNVGEPLKPLAKTASGGELSRVMLAMKAAAADRAMIPTMIFDEIDTGISGRVATVVGEKMDDIARYHQVICVTHLAQIAAMADTQYRVEKAVEGERTVTTVNELTPLERTEEIARLVGAEPQRFDSGRVHAANLLETAAARKLNRREAVR